MSIVIEVCLTFTLVDGATLLDATDPLLVALSDFNAPPVVENLVDVNVKEVDA